MALLQVESGKHPQAGTHPEMIAIAGGAIRDALQSNSEKTTRLGNRQFRFLVVGDTTQDLSKTPALGGE